MAISATSIISGNRGDQRWVPLDNSSDDWAEGPGLLASIRHHVALVTALVLVGGAGRPGLELDAAHSLRGNGQPVRRRQCRAGSRRRPADPQPRAVPHLTGRDDPGCSADGEYAVASAAGLACRQAPRCRTGVARTFPHRARFPVLPTRSSGDSPDPAVQALGAAAWATRLRRWRAARSGRARAEPGGIPAQVPVGVSVRRIAQFGYLGTGNIGNDACFETVLLWLRANLPDVEACCFASAPEAMRSRFGVLSASMSSRWPGGAPGSLAAVVGKFGSRLLDLPRNLALAGSVDAVIVPGMGVLEDTIGVRPWRMPLFLMATACRLRRRPFMLLDVGAGPIDNRLTRALFLAAVRLATHVSYRDGWSAEAMCKAGVRAPHTVAPDLAFAHPAKARADPQPGLVVVGVMAYYGKRDDPVRAETVRSTYVASLTKALVHLIDAGDRVILVGGDRVDDDVAREVHAAVRMARSDLTPEALVVREPTTFEEVTELMDQAEVVVASRFHNLICALRLARPTVSLGYAAKQSWLMRELGLEEYCQEILQLDADRLVAQLRAARAEGSFISARIREATREYASDVTSLLEGMAAVTFGLPGAGSVRRDE